ncbi:hypothetical protein HDF15_002836 [Granulicella mallensis]|uniref:Uncharacterized protein n=1 Tax=Granulicella mallensis TaxID=940614 RepID=A0A7W7ZQZ6_9BACT|nr:hypothetical protein [Granulicella mallensis]
MDWMGAPSSVPVPAALRSVTLRLPLMLPAFYTLNSLTGYAPNWLNFQTPNSYLNQGAPTEATSAGLLS